MVWKRDERTFLFASAPQNLFGGGIYNAGYEGISGLLAVMISEYEKLELYHDDGYLLLCADYPWYMSEREKNLTHEEFISILSKYVKLITDEELEIQTYFIDCDE